MRGMALNYKFRPQSVQKWLDLLGNTTPNNWECVHTIPGTSPNLAFSMKSIAISPDGKTIASASKIWDLQTGELLRYTTQNYLKIFTVMKLLPLLLLTLKVVSLPVVP